MSKRISEIPEPSQDPAASRSADDSPWSLAFESLIELLTFFGAPFIVAIGLVIELWPVWVWVGLGWWLCASW